MCHPLLRAFAALLGLSLAAVAAHAQGTKTAWHGQWSSGDLSVQIGAQGIKQGADWCQWVAAKPAKLSGCVAFDDMPVAKDQLARLLDDADQALKPSSSKKDQNSGLSPEARQQRRAEIQRQRQLLKGMSAGELPTVAIARAGAGDCSVYYFLDRASLYQVTDCLSQPQAAQLRVFKK